VYEMRDKLCGPLESFITEADREQFSSELTATEDWLYEDGEDEKKQVGGYPETAALSAAQPRTYPYPDQNCPPQQLPPACDL